MLSFWKASTLDLDMRLGLVFFICWAETRNLAFINLWSQSPMIAPNVYSPKCSYVNNLQRANISIGYDTIDHRMPSPTVAPFYFVVSLVFEESVVYS